MDSEKLEAVRNLKPGERIEIPATQEQVMDLEMIYLKISAYQNLFATLMLRTSEKASELSLKAFMDAYAEIAIKEYYLLKPLIVSAIGQEGFDWVKCPSCSTNIDIDEYNKILYVKNTATECNTCDL